MRKISIILITTLLFMATAFVDSAEGGFFDVGKDNWYYDEVKSVYKLGIVNGYPDGTFRPNENITIAEAIVMAVKVFNSYTNNEQAAEIFGNADEVPWYQSEINFAIKKGMIKQNDFPDYEKIATRSEIAYIFANILPEDQYTPINRVNKLPDVDNSNRFEASILKLYRAGILYGNDDYGTFQPDKEITRAEVSAIANREIFPKKRKTFELGAPSEPSKDSIALDVKNIAQNKELPNGCSITSLAIVLNYLGYDVDKCTLADNYLPKQKRYIKDGIPYGPNPYVAYPGDPRDSTGWYCYPPPIIQAANTYLKEKNSTYEAVDLTGITQSGLEGLLKQGYPIIVWVTRGLGELEQSKSTYWKTEEGEEIYPYTTIHSVVLTGYDDSTFKVADPLKKITSAGKDEFMTIFQEVGSHAMIVR